MNEPVFQPFLGSEDLGPPQEETSAISRENREILERAKIQLTMRPDFNLIDAFRIFDIAGRGWITAQQILDGLHEGLRCYV